METKPELLMPAGSAESFFAALEGGADAVYLGLKQFNARGRAANFSPGQLPGILRIAHGKGVKLYLTFNTVLKNSELAEAIEMVGLAAKVGVDAIIVQDWGLYFILANYFPELKIHASTQMGNHNSTGVLFSKEKGFSRVILARELTSAEVKTIAQNSPVELEIFVHGAFCYSFSGMCLFSSYVGGRGANRGMCAQPCRHNYLVGGGHQFPFSLKDNEQLKKLGELASWGISSFKVEGRMKSAEYVYRVAKAYRLAIGHPEKIDEAVEMLKFDFGRQKTAYFLGADLSKAVSEETATGLPVGVVEKVNDGFFSFFTQQELNPGYKIRVQTPGKDSRSNLTISNFWKENDLVGLKIENQMPLVGDIVYLTGMPEKKFPSVIKEQPLPASSDVNNLKKEILSGIKFKKQLPGKEKLYFRISSTTWLKHIRINELDGLFLSFTKKEWGNFKVDAQFIQNNREKIFIELPKFISEKSTGFYRELLGKFGKAGLPNCVISHLSQKLLVPQGWKVFANENVYTFNDAAIRMIEGEGVSSVVYPLESDFENLKAGSHRSGIVPLYFFPELFYSRMPVRIGEDGLFSNEDGKQFRQLKKGGMTIVVPGRPVSFLQYKKQLSAEGFSNFLIDLSYDNPSKNRFNTLLAKFKTSEQVQPSTNFNFRLGMK
jgi:U32 family peptidase